MKRSHGVFAQPRTRCRCGNGFPAPGSVGGPVPHAAGTGPDALLTWDGSGAEGQAAFLVPTIERIAISSFLCHKPVQIS